MPQLQLDTSLKPVIFVCFQPNLNLLADFSTNPQYKYHQSPCNGRQDRQTWRICIISLSLHHALRRVTWSAHQPM